MKLPIIAAILLILTMPAIAAKPISAKQWRDIHAFHHAYDICNRADPEQHPAEVLEKGCKASDRLEKKLEAQGFCTYGHVSVGRAGKPWTQKEWKQMGFPNTPWRRHCYPIHDPDPDLDWYTHHQ